MVPLLYTSIALFCGVVATLHQPARLPIRLWPLLAGAALLQYVRMESGVHHLAFWLSAMMISAWLVANRTVPGLGLMALGIALNYLAMAWHGGAMPVRADILQQLGLNLAPGTFTSKDIVVTSSPVWLLSDWIALPVRGILLVSPGDLLVFGGILVWTFAAFQKGTHDGSSHAQPA